jgi:hypothetical protein
VKLYDTDEKCANCRSWRREEDFDWDLRGLKLHQKPIKKLRTCNPCREKRASKVDHDQVEEITMERMYEIKMMCQKILNHRDIRLTAAQVRRITADAKREIPNERPEEPQILG